MAKILHIGDVHIKDGPNLDDTVQALEQVAALSHRERVDAVLLPGDVFDTKSTPAERGVFRRFIMDLDPIPLVVCRGNHDAPGDLLPFDLARNVTVYEQPGLVTFPDFDLAVFPWPERAHLAAQGFTGEGGLQTAQRALGDLIRNMCASRPVLDRPLVVMGHLSVCGALTSSGQPLVGREIQAVLGDLTDLGASYIALNHIHKPQDMAPGISYAGSLTIQDFGEEGEVKRLVLVEPKSGGADSRSVPVHGRGWLTIDAAVGVGPDEQKGRFIERVTGLDLTPDENGLVHFDTAGANVRYRYACTEEESHLFDHPSLERRFAGVHSLKIEPKVTRSQRVRSAEVAEARSVKDKLLAWGRATDTQVTAGMLSKLDQIGGA